MDRCSFLLLRIRKFPRFFIGQVKTKVLFMPKRRWGWVSVWVLDTAFLLSMIWIKGVPVILIPLETNKSYQKNKTSTLMRSKCGELILLIDCWVCSDDLLYTSIEV